MQACTAIVGVIDGQKLGSAGCFLDMGYLLGSCLGTQYSKSRSLHRSLQYYAEQKKSCYDEAAVIDMAMVAEWLRQYADTSYSADNATLHYPGA